MPSKEQIRERIKRLRQGLDHEWIYKNSQLIQHRLLEHRIYRESQTLGLYLARADEVDTRQILDQAWKDEKTVFVPRYDPDTQQYALCLLEPETTLQEGPWGIPEPAAHQAIDPEQADLMLIPAVALDRQGSRLGHGGGFYDRILSGFRGIKAGLVFEFQVMEDIPMQDHDIPIDFIITETDFFETLYYTQKIR